MPQIPSQTAALLPPDEWLLELKEIEDQLAELLPERAPQQPEPVDAEFTPPVVEIPEPIRTGAAPFYVVVVSDDNPRGPGGEPIVWEHPLQSTTLQAVLRKQADIGSRYGTTHIAECRIIPELTREVQADV